MDASRDVASGLGEDLKRTPPARNLLSLQAGRAVAAILVIFHHDSSPIFPKYFGQSPFGRLFDFGDAGVFYFFVLSGFIILNAHWRDLGHPNRVGSFLWKRFRRIYPMYWIVLVAVLPVYFLVRSFGHGYETQISVILSSFLLVHFTDMHVVSDVSWTLFHEVLFYALFALAIWHFRLGAVILAVWIALSVVAIDTTNRALITAFYLSPLHILFGLGMFAGWYVRSRAVARPALTSFIGFALFALAAVDEDYLGFATYDWRAILFGMGSTLIVVGLVELERQGRLSVPRLMALLGDASYSIYLLNLLVLSILAKLARSMHLAALIPAQALYVLLAIATVLDGLMCHLLIERPLLARLGSGRRARRIHVEAGLTPIASTGALAGNTER